MGKSSDNPPPAGKVLSPERRLFLTGLVSATAFPSVFVEEVKALELPKEGRVGWAQGIKLLHESIHKNIEHALVYVGDKENGEWLRSFAGQESRVLIRYSDILETLKRGRPEDVMRGVVISHTHPKRAVEMRASAIRASLPKNQLPVFASSEEESARFEELKDFLSLPSSTDVMDSYNTLFNTFMALSGFAHGEVVHDVVSECYRWSIKSVPESPAYRTRLQENEKAVNDIKEWLSTNHEIFLDLSKVFINKEWDAVLRTPDTRFEFLAIVITERFSWWPNSTQNRVRKLPGFSSLSSVQPLLNSPRARHIDVLQSQLAREIYSGKVTLSDALARYTKELYDVCGLALTYEQF